MTRDSLADHNVVATFGNLEDARGAIEALERGGIEAAKISLLGRPAVIAANDTDPRERDAGVVKRLTKFSIIGGAVGAVVGALAGAVIGGLLFGLDGQGLWTAIAGMAVVGLSIGGLVAPTAVLPQSPAWDTTFEESAPSGRVRVGVHANDQGAVRRAMEILRDRHPMSVEQLDGDGRRMRMA